MQKYLCILSIEEDTEVLDEEIESSKFDENSVLVQNGANVTMKNITLNLSMLMRNSNESI